VNAKPNSLARHATIAEVQAAFEALPPTAIEAEMSLLGSLLIEPARLADVRRLVPDGGSFSKPANGAVFDAMLRLHDERGTLDIVLLHQDLADRGTLEAVGGLAYLGELANAVPTARHAVEYAREVAEKAAARHFIEVTGDAFVRVRADPHCLRDVLIDAQARLADVGAELARLSTSTTTIADGFIDPAEDVTATIPTGCSWFDQAFADGAPARGRMYVWAAPPKVGKSSLMLMAVLSALKVDPDVRALWCLGEMSERTLRLRALSVLSGLTAMVLQRPVDQLGPEQQRKREAGIESFQQVGQRLHVLRAPFTCEQIDAAVQTTGADVVVVDYLQKIQPSNLEDTRREQVDAISQRLSRIAVDRDAVLMVVSNMSGAAATGHASMSNAFKESSGIGYDADAGFLGVLDKPIAELLDAGEELPPQYKVIWRCLGTRHGDASAIVSMFDRGTLRFYGEGREPV